MAIFNSFLYVYQAGYLYDGMISVDSNHPIDAMNYSEGIFYGISMECQTDMGMSENGVYIPPIIAI